MATINGKSFNLRNHTTRTTVVNPTVSPPNQNNVITHLGYEGLEIDIEGYCIGENNYDDIMREFLKPGQKELEIKTGWKYYVHATRQRAPRETNLPDNYYPFRLTLKTEEPYQFTTSKTIRTKSITSDGEQFSQDDSGNPITTGGYVDTVPDVKLETGSNVSTSYTEIVLTDSVQTGDSDQFSAFDYRSDERTTYNLAKTDTITGTIGQKIHLTNVNVELEADRTVCTVYVKVTYETSSISETKVAEWSESSDTWTSHEKDVDIFSNADEDMTLRWYIKSSNDTYGPADARDRGYVWEMRKRQNVESVTIHNIENDNRKMQLCNVLIPFSTIELNADGTGKYNHIDDYSTGDVVDIVFDNSAFSYDSTNEQIDLGTDGYVTYKFDCRYPIREHPVLQTKIDSAGTPTIQIAVADATGQPDTWRTIEKSVVTGSLTEYKLKSSSLELKGETVFFVKIDFSGTSGSIDELQLDAEITSIDVPRPLVYTGSSNTFEVNFGMDSPINATVTLSYPDRKFAG